MIVVKLVDGEKTVQKGVHQTVQMDATDPPPYVMSVPMASMDLSVTKHAT